MQSVVQQTMQQFVNVLKSFQEEIRSHSVKDWKLLLHLLNVLMTMNAPAAWLVSVEHA
jgi:hypothetical protein